MGESVSKEKRKRHAGYSIAKEDMINKLPDSLISHILLYLPTKEVVRTSVLSIRWKSLWLLIHELDLESSEFSDHNAFMSFMDKFVDFSREQKSCLHKHKLSIRKDENDQFCLTRWIDFVATSKLKHLDVECFLVKSDCLEVMPVSLYRCDTLVYLRLHRVLLGKFESVTLPRLKTMRLERNMYANEACLELLISSCLVPEDLSIVRRFDENVKILRVRSQTLTSLSVGFDFGVIGRAYDLHRGDSELVIDAPRLKCLDFIDELSKSIIISNLNSLVKVSFDGIFEMQYSSDGVGLSMNQMARNFFTGISSVRDMIISIYTMMFIDSYLRVEPLPKFCNLSYFEAEFCSSNADILSTFLQCCPNLKSIILDLYHFKMIDPISCSIVPQCLLSSLEIVEIRTRFMGTCLDMEVARYFVENSVVLKKFLVHLSSSGQKQSLVFLRDLLALPRPSSMCQIVYVADCENDSEVCL